ncbi:hypothetical protein VTO73DRAFT_14627 [Trametes versicolor]
MPALDAAERGTAREQSLLKRPASQVGLAFFSTGCVGGLTAAMKDTPEHGHKWRWPGSIDQFSTHLDRNGAPRIDKSEHMGMNPDDPCKWPPERICFILGIFCFPLWILGAFWQWRDGFEPFADLHKWRCQVMLMMASVIVTGLVVVQVTFRET